MKAIRSKEIKKSIYKKPLGIATLILTVIILLYITVNLPKQKSVKAIETKETAEGLSLF